ncbi:MAG: hypothetical protein II829_05170 [Bacteroidales bacterium]|nr:hypothetical protein [Bacteroidales bacterium]
MNKLSKTIVALMALFVIGFLAMEGCDKQNPQPKVSDFFISGCNDVVLYDMRDNDYPYIDTIYVTTIDNTKLKISTTNTQFPCDAYTIRPEIQAQEQNISIELLYEDSWADCICGRHLDIILENLKLGQTYFFSIKKDERDYFQFEVTFGPDTNLMFVREE